MVADSGAFDADSRVSYPRATGSVLAAVALAACGAAACAAALALTSDHVSHPGVHATLMVWMVLAYVLAGLVAWWRGREIRFGLLMIAAGAAIFVSSNGGR